MSTNAYPTYIAPANQSLAAQYINAGADSQTAQLLEQRNNANAGNEFLMKMNTITRSFAPQNRDTRAVAGSRGMALSPATMLRAAQDLRDREAAQRAQAQTALTDVAHNGSDASLSALMRLLAMKQAFGADTATSTGGDRVSSIGAAY